MTKKKLLNLYHTAEGSKSIILYPEEEKPFKAHLKDYKEKNIYTLYMNCYNLPGARIRYQQTDIFNAYTIYSIYPTNYVNYTKIISLTMKYLKNFH